jgi:hypothetical protein
MGPGRLLRTDGTGRLYVHFPWIETEAVFESTQASIEPYQLFGGTPVACQQDNNEAAFEGLVLNCVGAENGLSLYRVGLLVGDDFQEVDIPENHLLPLPPKSRHPLDHFKALTWQGPTRFLRRWRLRLLESRWMEDSGGIPAFLGARIHPLGHQIYAARRVLWDRVPRFILADEVGLGKTIEAGLIIQSLMAEKPGLRVLVIAPGGMARQWQTELYLRFGAVVFKHLDGTTWNGLSRAEKHSVLHSPRLIVTTTLIQTNTELAPDLIDERWDLVVIDEAHQFPPGTALYELFHALARRSRGLLALSATPSKREITSLAGLLALVAPEVYGPTDHDALAERIRIQRGVWDKLHLSRSFLDAASESNEALQADDLSYLADEWEGLLPGDPVVNDLLARLKNGEARAAEELVAYVQEFHRLDHRVIRTRRSTLQRERSHWSYRKVEVLRYDCVASEAMLANHLDALPDLEEPDPLQSALRGLYLRKFSSTPDQFVAFLEARHRAVCERGEGPQVTEPLLLLTADPSPADEELIVNQILGAAPPLPNERPWLETALGLARDWQSESGLAGRLAALTEWLSVHLGTSPNYQVLIFAQDREVVEALTEGLSNALPDHAIQSFHHGMEESDLAQVALRFQRNKGCRVLVSDELGGEGRNFQNASALVHFDLPWSVARMEQRIGRLDRVGRGGGRPVLSLVLQGPSAMDRALIDIHTEVFGVLTRSVGGLEYILPHLQLELNQAICEGPYAVNRLRASLVERVERELQDVDESFDLSLDASKLQLKDAQDLAEMLDDPVDWGQEAMTLAKWAQELGMRTHQLHDQTWKFEWEADELRRPIVGVPRSHFLSGTFSRELALEDERQQFLGPGHPLVDALLGDLAGSQEGRASLLLLRLGPRYHGRLFALILGRSDLGLVDARGTELPPGLRLRARRHLWPEVQSALLELHPGETPAASLVHDAALTFQLRSPETIKAQYQKMPPNDLGEMFDTLSLWAALEEAQSLAVAHIKEHRAGISQEAAKALKDELQPEIGFLNWRQSESPSKETRNAIEGRLRLIEAVGEERVDIEAIALIVGVQ